MSHENHDGHYFRMVVEPIQVMEERLFGIHNGPDPKHAFLLALAIKHIMRAGRKEGQPWRKDIEKAMNYLNRALTGEWIAKDSKGD